MFFSSSTLRLFDFSHAESCHRFDPLNVPGELVRALQQKHVQKWTNGSLTAQDGYIFSFPPRILGVLSTVGFIVVQAQCYTQIGQDGKNRQRDFWNSEMFLGFSEIVEIATQQHCHGDFCAGQLLGIWISLKPRKKGYISYINIKNINCSNVVFHRKIAFIWDQASDPHILCYACYASCMHGSARLLTRLRHVTSSPCIFGIFGVGGCYAASLCQGWFQLFSSFPACTTSSSSLARTMNLCRWVMVRVRLRKSVKKWI